MKPFLPSFGRSTGTRTNRLAGSLAACFLALMTAGATAASGGDTVAPLVHVADPVPLDVGPRDLAEKLLSTGDAKGAGSAKLADWDGVVDSTLAAHGDLAPLLALLEASADDETAPLERRQSALRGLARAQYRDGSIGEALARTTEFLAREQPLEMRILEAELLDAQDDHEEATAAWRVVRDATDDPAVRARAGLRIALLDATRPPLANASRIVERDSELFRLAGASDDAAFKRRAAIVLGLLGRPREAIALYEPLGTGSELFRQEIRRAEWALAAKAPLDAQRFAWNARAAAQLKRDRLYAIAVLVEAHRADDSLGRLIDRLAAEPELDAESRRVWIDLLRETSRVDEALALFRAGAAGGFTTEMRRDLLEMCRASGRDDELVATYREMIVAESDTLEWRVGLARWFLEHGRRGEAEATLAESLDAGAVATRRLAVAEAARDLGLDELAQRCADECLGDPVIGLESRLFLFDFDLRRGSVEKAIAELDAFDRAADPRSPERVRLSEAYERVGDKKRAADVLERIRASRGSDEAEEDLEMRLAWLLSETGDEAKALERWRNLWSRVNSLSRRRQVEDRLMAVASRLGVLADIAVELEEKLAAGKANERDAALLVRLYQKVGDPVSAAEVIDEHMKQTGADPIASLSEKSRVYLGGKDYYHFEKTIRKLLEIDVENKADRLRQLAMSQLERGRPEEARDVLARLAKEEDPSDAAEFEAGVLSLANLHDEAARTYRKGLARHPDRIDTYLLLGNTLRSLGSTDRAIGMFEYLVEHSEKDDLFTIAIDGLLNMRAPASTLQHALRVTLERIANGTDRMYLFQLHADLSEELKDIPARMRALEASLPIAAEQRASVLRELMDVAQGGSTNSFTIVNGMLVQQRQGGDEQRRLAYGRRLIGLGDVVPPAVYLELGEAFLRSNEVTNAAKTFAMARDVPDFVAFQRQIASSFESAGFVADALDVYERSLASQGVEIALLLKTAELNEQLGRDDAARDLYRRGIEILLARHPLVAKAAAKKDRSEDPFLDFVRNVGDFDKYATSLIAGFSAVATDAQARDIFDSELALLRADIAELGRSPPAEGAKLADAPRLAQRGRFLREQALSRGLVAAARGIDLELLAAMPGDDAMLDDLCEARARRGLVAAAIDLVRASGRSAEVQQRALAKLGVGDAEAARPTVKDAMSRILPPLVGGDREAATRLLRAVPLTGLEAADAPNLMLLFSAATFLDDDASVVAFARAFVRAAAGGEDLYELGDKIEAMLKRARSAVEPDAFRLIVEALTEAADKKNVFSAWSFTLSELQRNLGRPLFTVETLRKRIEECAAAEPYMISTYAAMAPKEERVGLMQAVWSKVPPTERVEVASSLLSGRDEAVSKEVESFVTGVFEAEVGKVSEPRMLTYPLRAASDAGDSNLPVIEKLLRLVVERHGASAELQALYATVALKCGHRDVALAAMGASIDAMPGVQHPYEASSACDTLRRGFQGADSDALIAALTSAAEKAAGSAETIVLQLAAVYDERKEPEKAIEVLSAALDRAPDSVSLMEALAFRYATVRDRPRQLELLERTARADPRNEQRRKTLSDEYRAQRDPVRAAAALRGEEAADRAPPAEVGRKLEPATLATVKKAVDEGRLVDASVLWRRTWRNYQSNDGPYFGRVYSFGASTTPSWPDAAAAKDRARSRGGLSDFPLDEPSPDADVEDSESADAPKSDGSAPRQSAYEAIGSLPFGPDALLHQVRSLETATLQRSRDLVRALERSEVKASGADAAVQRWLEVVRSGNAGTLERSLLLAYCEDNVETLTERDRGIVAEVMPAIGPNDTGPLRALARIHAKLGDSALASRIYQWCATLASSSRWIYEDAQGVTVAELVEEIPKHLAGEERIAAIAAVLDRSDPGGSIWERDEHFAMRLSTWRKVAGAAEAGKRCAGDIDAIVSRTRGLLRRSAPAASRILAECGDVDRALAALEVALCSFRKADVRFEEEDVYATRYQLEAPYIGFEAIRMLFPKDASSMPSDWLDRVDAKVVEWTSAGRLRPETARSFLVAIAVRRHERGEDALAASCVDRIASGPSRGSEHLLIDLDRLIGREDRAAALEDELLARNALHPERVKEVVERVKRTQGAERALAVGAAAIAFTPHPDLVEFLIGLATETGRAEDRERFEKVKADQLAAAVELKQPW